MECLKKDYHQHKIKSRLLLINIWRSFGLSWNRGPCSPPWNQTRLTTLPQSPPAPLVSCTEDLSVTIHNPPWTIIFLKRILFKNHFSVSQTLSEMRGSSESCVLWNNRRNDFRWIEDHCSFTNIAEQALAVLLIHYPSCRHFDFLTWVQLRERTEELHYRPVCEFLQSLVPPDAINWPPGPLRDGVDWRLFHP